MQPEQEAGLRVFPTGESAPHAAVNEQPEQEPENFTPQADPLARQADPLAQPAYPVLQPYPVQGAYPAAPQAAYMVDPLMPQQCSPQQYGHQTFHYGNATHGQPAQYAQPTQAQQAQRPGQWKPSYVQHVAFVAQPIISPPWFGIYLSICLMFFTMSWIPGLCLLLWPTFIASEADNHHRSGRIERGNARSLAARRALWMVWAIEILLILIGIFIVFIVVENN